MQVSCSVFGIVDKEKPNNDIKKIVSAGFNRLYLDFGMFYSQYELEIKDRRFIKDEFGNEKPSKALDEFIKDADNFIKVSKDKAGFIVSTAPTLQDNTKRDDLYGFVKQLTIESIKLSAKAGCKYIIIKPLLDISQDANTEYYLELGQYAKEHNITILIKNQYKNFNGRLTRGLFSTPKQAIEYINRLNNKINCFGFCIDTGVCSICKQDLGEFINAMTGYTKAIILRDSDIYTNSYMMPFTNAVCGKSSTDWEGFIKELRQNKENYELILDMKDTFFSFKPFFRLELLKFANSISKYLIWQIEIERTLKSANKIVLFGAGNMCKNYMKYYGEKYPPLFTCDNNSSLWGSYAHGLQVKNPEELKKLDEDCMIFICNTYYDEIAQQLKNMDIKNKIEYFNDEYLFNGIF